MKKVVKGLTYNFVFDYETGFFARWGKNYEDDPLYSPGGPEIADIEISTICSGPFGKRCTFCYKNDTTLVEKNMSLKTFQTIIEKINPKGFLCQVALGVGDVDANPDLVPILRYCRENNFVFDYETGFFARWGKNYEDDPLYSPGGPEIADIEISTICSGPFGKRCTLRIKGFNRNKDSEFIKKERIS